MIGSDGILTSTHFVQEMSLLENFTTTSQCKQSIGWQNPPRTTPCVSVHTKLMPSKTALLEQHNWFILNCEYLVIAFSQKVYHYIYLITKCLSLYILLWKIFSHILLHSSIFIEEQKEICGTQETPNADNWGWVYNGSHT